MSVYLQLLNIPSCFTVVLQEVLRENISYSDLVFY